MAITLLLFPVAAFTTGAVRIILGLPVVFFIPGYMLLSALFPHKDSLSPVARITYSLGLSAAFNIITGAVLNFTPWGIEMLPILTVAAFFIGINAAIAWRRSRQTDEELDFTVDIDLYRWRQTAGVDKILSVLLVVAVLAAVGSVGYVLAVPKQDQQFTEFYVLTIDGRAEDYPSQVVAGEALEVTLGIINHEDMTLSYQVVVLVNGVEDSRIDTAQLVNDARWEATASLVLDSPGEDQKIEFWLYEAGESEPYFEEPLFIHLDVSEA
ncbi:DUF1616 domain-containing protein [Chloroflexota bacterium]